MSRALSLGVLLLLVSGPVHAHGDASAFVGTAMKTESGSADALRPRYYPAQVRIDPRHVSGVVLKVNARVINVADLYVGRPVRSGDVLAEFESAELETIQRTFAETVANLRYVEAASTTVTEKLVEARMNLGWRGLSDQDIRALEETRQPIRRVDITAPTDGYLLEIAASEGQVVNPGAQAGLFSLSGTTLFRIADADAVTIEAQIPAAVAAGLDAGDEASLRLPGNAAQLDAVVDEVLPYSAPSSLRRTVRLRPLASASLLGLRDGLRLAVTVDAATAEATEAPHEH